MAVFWRVWAGQVLSQITAMKAKALLERRNLLYSTHQGSLSSNSLRELPLRISKIETEKHKNCYSFKSILPMKSRMWPILRAFWPSWGRLYRKGKQRRAEGLSKSTKWRKREIKMPTYLKTSSCPNPGNRVVESQISADRDSMPQTIVKLVNKM